MAGALQNTHMSIAAVAALILTLPTDRLHSLWDIMKFKKFYVEYTKTYPLDCDNFLTLPNSDQCPKSPFVLAWLTAR